MQYLGQDIPKLGFGLMRPPMKGDEIDLDELARMVDVFMDAGFTYFDTAPSYLDGKSEEAIRKVLVERYPRGSYQLATKLPAWSVSSPEAAHRMIEESLERTGARYFDFYLLHNLNTTLEPYFDKYGIWDLAVQQKRAGTVRHWGFSFHDKPDFLNELIVKHPDAEFVQLQINYADWDNKAIESRRNFEVARANDKPVIVMEPVKGGSLANPPEEVAKEFRKVNPVASFSSWAIRFAASLPQIITVLSGMSSLEQMRDNVDTMSNFEPFNGEELMAVTMAQKAIAGLNAIECTDCRYCMAHCPAHINIPGVFKALNNYLIYDNRSGAERSYAWETRNGGCASDCLHCGQCDDICPQRIGPMKELETAVQVFGR